MADQMFRDEVEKAILLYEEINKHYATRTRQMIRDIGEIEALSRLMISADLQQGFKTLRDADQLDKTFESFVVQYQYLFEIDVIEAAQWRFQHPYQLL